MLPSRESAISLPDIDATLQALSVERPVFHSESDLQHAVAWAIHEQWPECHVRLEVNPYRDGQRAYQDIVLRHGQQLISIELKYKTRKLDMTVADEEFHLLDQSAQDQGRYDFIKDIERLERFVQGHPGSSGIALFLTNDATYWLPTRRPNTVDHQFRIHEEAVLRGRLTWSELASPGTQQARERALELTGEYPLTWRHYSGFDAVPNGDFRYLLLHVEDRATAI